MKIESTAFKHGQPIPNKYTCEGQDVSPPLSLINVPKGAKSLAIIVDDPDAPAGVFDHWLAWNISPAETIPEGAKVPYEGMNGFSVNHYKGPCPPIGKPHRYYFKIYALDTFLDLPQGSAKIDLEEEMENHILEEAEIMGTYHR